MLALLDFHQLGAQHAHTLLLILELVTLGLTGDHDAGGLVDQPHGGGSLVDVLAAGAGGTVDLHFIVFRADFHVLTVVLDVRDDLNG